MICVLCFGFQLGMGLDGSADSSGRHCEQIKRALKRGYRTVDRIAIFGRLRKVLQTDDISPGHMQRNRDLIPIKRNVQLSNAVLVSA